MPMYLLIVREQDTDVACSSLGFRDFPISETLHESNRTNIATHAARRVLDALAILNPELPEPSDPGENRTFLDDEEEEIEEEEDEEEDDEYDRRKRMQAAVKDRDSYALLRDGIASWFKTAKVGQSLTFARNTHATDCLDVVITLLAEPVEVSQLAFKVTTVAKVVPVDMADDDSDEKPVARPAKKPAKKPNKKRR